VSRHGREFGGGRIEERRRVDSRDSCRVAPLRSAELNFVKSEDQHPILAVDHHDAESAHFQKPASPIEHESGIARFLIGTMVTIGRG
jgi:hypothetical protein